jgi:predicted methyltransferase MtxX (methanogen marker protein 4)
MKDHEPVKEGVISEDRLGDLGPTLAVDRRRV